MKNYTTKLTILLCAFIALFVVSCVNAQQISRLSGRCPTPYQSTYSSIEAVAAGDLVHTPCNGRASIFTGIVDFSGASIIGSGFVTGTGTTNFIPRWTNGAGGVIGDTPFSWNGTTYRFDNTALNAENVMTFTPAGGGSGSFLVGDAVGVSQNYFNINNLSGAGSWQTSGSARIGDLLNAGQLFTLDSNRALFNAPEFKVDNITNDATFGLTLQTGQTGAGALTIGEVTRAGLTIENSSTEVSLFGGDGAGSGFVNIDSKTSPARIGDVNTAGNGTLITVDDSTDTITANSAAGIITIGDLLGGGQQLVVNNSSDAVSLGVGGAQLNINTTGATLIHDTGSVTVGGSGNLAQAVFDEANAETTIGVGNIIAGATLQFTGSTFDFRGRSGGVEAGVFDLTDILNYQYFRTITPAGTTGNQTINKPAGSVNFAAGATAIRITSTVVTADSIILVTQNNRGATLDTTCTSFGTANFAAGAFDIRANAACTAETRVSFLIIN